jgi:16S rRNA (cytosine967-C5)-methyltransferase
VNARALALNLLNDWQKSRQLADELLELALASTTLQGPDRAFVTELFYGCLRQQLALKFLLARLVDKLPRPVISNVLKLGLYQLFFLRTPAHAAVNESVALARERGGEPEAKFVNAVLRQAAREYEKLLAELQATRETKPWIYHSHPEWLWKRWAMRLGHESAAALCEWNNQPPMLYLRVNALKASAKPADVSAEPTDNPLCWRVTNASGLFRTRSFLNGEFYVQDPSTLTAVDVLDPQPG